MALYDDDFPTCLETYASLRIYSHSMSPTEITKVLKVAPTRQFAMGESHSKGLARKYHGWVLCTQNQVTSRDTRRHVDWILSRIADKGWELDELRAQGAEMDISCLWVSIGQGGPILSPPQMKSLAQLSLDIWWDVYVREPFCDTSTYMAKE